MHQYPQWAQLELVAVGEDGMQRVADAITAMEAEQARLRRKLQYRTDGYINDAIRELDEYLAVGRGLLARARDIQPVDEDDELEAQRALAGAPGDTREFDLNRIMTPPAVRKPPR